MLFSEKAVALRNGARCVLRSPGPNDAAAMLEYLRLTSGETHYMIRTPGEICQTLPEEEEMLSGCLCAPRAVMIGAWFGPVLAGNCGLNPVADQQKLRHRATFGIAVKQEFWGLGLGGLLLDEAIRAARSFGYEQLELGVFSGNGRARRLYASRGFRETGTIPRAFRLGSGRYEDEIQMALPFPPSDG